MDYPIYENGREIGRLYARQEGLYTVLEAALSGRRALTRLYVLSEAGWRALGVMEPYSGGCRLIRRLSRRELPGAIRYVSTAPQELPSPVREAAPGWVEQANGVLLDKSRGLIAFPARLRQRSVPVRITRINGKEYIVFRW